jgi:formate/nitrite transporter
MVFHPPVQIIAKGAGAGKYKAGLEWWNMILRGFMSGAYIAMGGALATVCSTGVADNLGDGFGRLILGAVFPVGLIITVLTGAELFTGDAMLAPLAAFIHKISWMSVLNLWVWVYIGNLIGSIFYAYIMANGPFVSFNAAGAATVNAFGVTAVKIAMGKISYAGVMGMWSAFLKGIGCNWLVNLAILLGICADDAIGKFFGIWFPIMAFVSSGFEHCVANMYFIPAGIMTSGYLSATQIDTFAVKDAAGVITMAGANKLATLNWISMWTNNVIIVTIGNIVGGLLFVGIIYWIAFKKEIEALE